MLGLPKDTEISMPLYKKDILLNFDGNTKQKEAFNREIESLRIVNELSGISLPVENSQKINGIFFIEVKLKKYDVQLSTVETIFNLIPQHIILILSYNEKIKLAINHSKTFMTDWLDKEYILDINGLSLDAIWTQIVEKIGNFTVSSGKNLDQQIEKNIKIQAILKDIKKLEKEKRTIKTPRMKFELHQKMIALAKKLDEIKRN